MHSNGALKLLPSVALFADEKWGLQDGHAIVESVQAPPPAPHATHSRNHLRVVGNTLTWPQTGPANWPYAQQSKVPQGQARAFAMACQSATKQQRTYCSAVRLF